MVSPDGPHFHMSFVLVGVRVGGQYQHPGLIVEVCIYLLNHCFDPFLGLFTVHEQGLCTSDLFKESGWWDSCTSDLTSSEVEKRKQKKEIRIVVKGESEKEHVNKQR